MPLYDCMLLFKPKLRREAIIELVARVGKHVYSRNGVLSDVKSLGTVQLGYGIKKLDGRYFQGRLMQMTMMATPNINKDLHYLNKEDRLLRWLLVKHRDTKYGVEFLTEKELSNTGSNILDNDSDIEEDFDEDRDIYDAEQEQKVQP